MKSIADSEPIIVEASYAATTPIEASISNAIDPAPMPVACRLRLHRWSRWGRVVIERTTNGERVIAERRYQIQGCLNCGARRERKV